MVDVTAIGELLIDFTTVNTQEDGFPVIAAHPGGAPPNFLAALNKFGAKTNMISKVGNDTFGHQLIQYLQEIGIGTEGIHVADDVFTTLAFVTVDKTGDREFSFARKPGADTQLREDELDLTMIDDTKCFHIGTLSLTDEPIRTATKAAVAYAKSKGKLITCDPNLRKPLWNNLDDAKTYMLWALEQADVVKISDNEVEFLFECEPAKGAEILLNKFNCKLVFVTCGPEGSCYATKRFQGFVPTIEGIKPVDTTGAGDIFGGSAISQLLKTGKDPVDLDQEELERITRFACAAASLSTQKYGGASSVPELEEIEAALRTRF